MKSVSIPILLLLGACDGKSASPASGPAAAPVTVFAASSLKEVVTAIAKEWSARTGRLHRLQFEATSTLARQIQEGAPADLFVSAAPEWLEMVKSVEKFDWLSNRLVCVVRTEEREFDLKRVESLALANEQVPAGKYARAALEHLGIRIPERRIYGQNVRDVLSRVSEGGAQAGIVYATDAAIDPRVRVATTFPPESHPRILYSVGLLRPEGKALYDVLREPWALEIARKHGFGETN
ncbi:MAG: molybdate ABC transporter substrate-binding protein [Planctomycetes bacterium]|nr:molybdate ABC transporter substrate-binding protein [Planctomycetota bacterium]